MRSEMTIPNSQTTRSRTSSRPCSVSGQLERSREVAQTLHQRTDSAVLGPIARAVLALVDGSTDGNLDDFRSLLLEMTDEQNRRGLRHYAGVSLLNIAEVDRYRGDIDGMLNAARGAIEALAETSAGLEIESARSTLAWAYAFNNQWDLAQEEMRRAQHTRFDAVRSEILIEHAQMHSMLGDRETAETLLAKALEAPRLPEVLNDLAKLTRAELALRRADLSTAQSELSDVDLNRPHPSLAFNARARFRAALVSAASASRTASHDAAAALHLAATQGARPYAAACRVLLDVVENARPDESLSRAAEGYPWTVSMLAEIVVPRLGALKPTSVDIVTREAHHRPIRWREPLRHSLIVSQDDATRYQSGRLLDQIGEASDVAVLRKIAKSLRGFPNSGDLGRGLARRLARRVVVLDHGRVCIRIGDEIVVGSEIRRKVLTLLCYLITRPQLGATRDQVLDALWPDFDPDVAGNSLNQTVYFLRRVFEPGFSDETSPGYIHHDL